MTSTPIALVMQRRSVRIDFRMCVRLGRGLLRIDPLFQRRGHSPPFRELSRSGRSPGESNPYLYGAHKKKIELKTLTVSTHADGDALLQAAILAAVPVDPQNRALLVLGARPVLDLLLDAAPEEALRITTPGLSTTIVATVLGADRVRHVPRRHHQRFGAIQHCHHRHEFYDLQDSLGSMIKNDHCSGLTDVRRESRLYLLVCKRTLNLAASELAGEFTTSSPI